MAIYLQLNTDGVVVNAIQYDGKSKYNPGEGIRIVEWDEDSRPWIGWTLLGDGSWKEPDTVIE